MAQGRSLVNRASSLCTSQCHDLRPSSFWRRFGPIFEPGQQGLLTLHFRVPWSPRCHRFEEVSFFRVSFHSFRQKRDSPSECLCPSNVAEAAAQAGAALEKACMRKVRETAEVCQREGIVFLPFALETLGGLHKGAITQVKLIATALARCKGVNEGEATGQLFGRLSQILMKANSLMLSTRCQDSDFPSPATDGIE